jgi:iron uptake system EfeUOB component EfeO/EfeM
MNLFIAEKRKNYTEQIEHKKEIMKNSSGGKNNIALSDFEKRFDKDKKALTQKYDENFEKVNSELEKAKENFLFSAMTEISVKKIGPKKA